MAKHDQSVADENVVPPASPGLLLTLNFEFTDIRDLKKEVNQVTSVFQKRGFEHRSVPIRMDDTSNTLEERLREFFPSEHSDRLLVIYYNGHGCLKEGDGLVLASHNHPEETEELQRDAGAFWKALDLLEKNPAKTSQPELPDELEFTRYEETNDVDSCHGSVVYSDSDESDSGESTWLHNFVEKYKMYQPIAIVSWSSIHRLIMAAKCDIAVILDCCSSGAAAIGGNKTEEALDDEFRKGVEQLANDEEEKYAKEILAACSWSSASRGHINDALVQVLGGEEYQEGMSLETLYDKIQKILGKKRLAGIRAAQPVRTRINTSMIRRKLRLKR